MKQNTVKVKERYNWPVTILMIIGIVLVILLPLYMALMIAIKDPTDMNNILALPRKIRLQNFADAWVMTNFPRKFLNTAFITVVNLIFTLITNSFAAYAITRNRKKSKILFTHVLLLYQCHVYTVPVIMLPLVVQANAFTWIIFSELHSCTLFRSSYEYVPLYRGSKGNPGALDEAAMIDGANPIQIFPGSFSRF